MLEDGYSINYISCKYGVGNLRLKKLWLLYQKGRIKSTASPEVHP